MAKCVSCEAGLADGSAFCSSCGAPQAPAVASGGVAPVAVPAPSPAAAPKTSTMAVVAFALSLIPICLNAVGFVLGIVALVRINGRPQELKGRGWAIAAVVIGPVGFIIGLLAAIAIPNFIMFQGRAKQSEARMMLRKLHTASASYAVDHTDRAQRFEDLGISFEPRRRYAYFFGAEVKQPTIGGPYQIPAELLAQISKPDVEAVAVGNIDHDDALDVWEVDSSGNVVSLHDDLHD